jgi:hypothetical protein
MRWRVVVLALALTACREANVTSPATPTAGLQEWVLPTGKPPSTAEFAAIVAACQDRDRNAATNIGLQPCLADYGVRRAP